MIILTKRKYEKSLKWLLANYNEDSIKWQKVLKAIERYEERHFPMSPVFGQEAE